VEVESAAKVWVFRDRFQYAAHYARTHPLLEPTMAGLVRWIALGQVGPRGTRSQNIQNSVEDFRAVFPGCKYRPPGKVEMSPFTRAFQKLNVNVRVSVKRRRAMLASNPIQE
jgi:hypothetical protein